MKPKATGTISGCVVWIIAFGVLSSCILPVAMIVGGVTSASRFAMQRLEPLICPDGTTAESYSYATTTTDEYGNSQPSTAYELHCIDANGVIVKKDPVRYAFLWIGMITIIGLVIAAVLAFALATPAGVLIAKRLNREPKQSSRSVIESL
jgi:ABC-type glycerol-3-phosphate transport system permease component